MDKQNNVDQFEKTLYKLRSDHEKQVAEYKFRYDLARDIEKSVFKIKITLTGIFAAIFTILFSNIENTKDYTTTFKMSFVFLLISAFLLLSEEVWDSISLVYKNLDRSKRDTALTNIRFHSYQLSEGKENSPYSSVVNEVTEQYNNEVAVLKDLKSGLTKEQILKKQGKERPWKFRLVLWTVLSFCVPILFLFELFFSRL